MSEPMDSGLKDRILSAAGETAITTIINLCGGLLLECFFKVDDDINKQLAILIVITIAIGLNYLAHLIIRKNRQQREFAKYEGHWLQIIPEMKERQYTILKLFFDKKDKKYILTGKNFDQELKTFVEFTAYRLVKRYHNNGFYYITNRTGENRNGLGKLCYPLDSRNVLTYGFDSDLISGLTIAEGYFYDASDEPSATKYNTIMLKCDEQFWKKILSQNLLMEDVTVNVEKLNGKGSTEIMERSKEFADRVLTEYWSKYGVAS